MLVSVSIALLSPWVKLKKEEENEGVDAIIKINQ